MPVLESVDKVATLLAEMPFAENHKDFLTALYSRQYHPRALQNRFISGFRLQGVFLPHMSAEKQKMRLNAANNYEYRFFDRLKHRQYACAFDYR